MKPVYGFELGDSIVVEYARVANYYGDVELMSPNTNFSSPNIVFRKVSSGNPLPPFFVGNTTDFVETPTNTYIAPYIPFSHDNAVRWSPVQCPLWVKSRHVQRKTSCPLYAPIADMCGAKRDVRLVPIADIQS